MDIGLNKYKKIINSQWGEDGILEEIFKRIGTKNKICVEFGAGNGKELSNIWYLIKDLGWHGLLMEPNEKNFNKWEELKKESDNFKVLKKFVSIDGENCLDSILENNNIDKDLDLLSIDIDSNDYHIFESLKKYDPRVVIIEHNPTIPPEFEAVQAPNEEENYGASAKSLVKLANKKGYKLVAATHTNCIFVHQKYFVDLNIQEPKLEDVFDRSAISYLVSAVNGSTYLACSNDYPSFTYLYDSYNLYAKKGSLHTLSCGLSINKNNSKTLSRQFKPVKIFWNRQENTVNLLHFIINIFNNLIKLIRKKYGKRK
ncbi:MAG: hypothetical protein AUJ23_01145 [Candidatus Magasanikbacteria bacterium CG1_02_32_51]|uniref:Methyltransferase FkbM domain-containing protein n=1 Tax=Candidatus Magasanikbacteria bacterium CG1_02_32_51 TaxID=1805238 RepID=A0A1J4UAV7_9BACT|nr:MAG: hypothetical protein AUJ23_01145 [Candidatus Magasanikbacteria bacterium CG1_02_32_51]